MTKLGFAFSDEEMALIRKLQARLALTLGKVSYIGVIRWALRQAEQSDKGEIR